MVHYVIMEGGKKMGYTLIMYRFRVWFEDAEVVAARFRTARSISYVSSPSRAFFLFFYFFSINKYIWLDRKS